MASKSRGRRKKTDFVKYLDSGNDQDGFKLCLMNDNIGYGVVATKAFSKGEFLLEYAGEKISEPEATKRESIYKDKNMGCFIYYNVPDIKGKICIDATYSEQYGRYVNDSPGKFANALMKRLITTSGVHLALFALRDIDIGTEIRYDYGDTSEQMSWRQEVANLKPLFCDIDVLTDKVPSNIIKAPDKETPVDFCIENEKEKERKEKKRETIACGKEDELKNANCEENKETTQYVKEEELQVQIDQNGKCEEQEEEYEVIPAIKKESTQDLLLLKGQHTKQVPISSDESDEILQYLPTVLKVSNTLNDISAAEESEEEHMLPTPE